MIVFHRWSIDTEAVCAGAIVSDWIASDEVPDQQYSAVLENFAVTRPGDRGRRSESCQCIVFVTGVSESERLNVTGCPSKGC